MISDLVDPRTIVATLVTVWVTIALVIGIVLVTHAVRVRRAAQRAVLDDRARPLVIDFVLDEDDAPAHTETLREATGGMGTSVDERLLAVLNTVTGDARERIVRMLIARGLPRRLRRATGSWRSHRRARAVLQLGLLGLPEDADLLTRALNDRAALVRAVAVRALGRHPSPQSAHAILGTIREDRAIPVLVSMNALLDIGHNPACHRIIREGLVDASPRVRAASARVLGDLTSAADARRIGILLDRDPVPSVQLAAATALRRIGTEINIPQLLAGTTSSWGPVRLEALRALLTLPAAATADALAQVRGLHDPVLVPLLDASADPRPEV
ncbi:MAG: HEAT repeat domain-containing protein [Brachybacterium sp.]|nr:HEAT repeat domain-containing protein [Brachybacterium sp.]